MTTRTKNVGIGRVMGAPGPDIA